MIRTLPVKISATGVNQCLRLYELLDCQEDYSRWLGNLLSQHASNEIRRILNDKYIKDG